MHSFQRVLRSFLLDLGNVDIHFVVLHILVGTYYQVDEGRQDDSSHDGEEVEADLTGDEAAQLVHDQSGTWIVM